MRPSDPVVDVRNLSKMFGRVEALRGLDLTVERGEVHGFLGPNGAGKSTTLRILLGLVRPTAGHARVFGADPWTDAVRLHRRMAYVPGDVTVWPSLTGGEIIDLLGRLRGRVDWRRRDELIDRFALDPGRTARTYSTGNRQKVSLIAAFAADAELIVLDEPTSGLDPLMEQVFAECVREASARGATVLLSSHILSEVDALCERVTIVRDGATVESGSLTDLRHLARVRVVADVQTVPDVGRLPGEVSVDGCTVTASIDPERLPELMRALADAGVTRLDSAPPTLEDLFLGYYEAR